MAERTLSPVQMAQMGFLRRALNFRS